MKTNEVDLLVIGAGATGASIAYEATQHGLKVALLDAGDIGGGTSCRSTKLLHGGVRYLELAFKNLDIAQLQLVREALIERSHWLEEAPFLSRRLKLALPCKNCFEKAYYQAGLGLYDALSGSKSIGKSEGMSYLNLYDSLPYINEKYNSGVTYSDGQFNDARLNLLIALTAEKAGAIIRNYCKVINFEFNANGHLKSALSQNQNGDKEIWKANIFVNATGIYADHIRRMIDPNVSKRITTSRGVHIVLEENLCKKDIGMILPSTEDGRVLFILPFYGQTLVGTTDTPCDITKAYIPENTEKEYLLKHLKICFPRIKDIKVTSIWAGSRPLLIPQNLEIKSSQLTREHEIEVLPCGLISAMGGKWTTCRKIAKDTLKAVFKSIKRPSIGYKKLSLIGTGENALQTKKLLKKQYEKLKDYLPKTDLLDKQIKHLQAKYGLEALQIIKECDPDHRVPLSKVIPICEAEIKRDIEHEHASTPVDILARRNRLAMVNFSEAKRLLPTVNKYLKKANISPGELSLEK